MIFIRNLSNFDTGKFKSSKFKITSFATVLHVTKINIFPSNLQYFKYERCIVFPFYRFQTLRVSIVQFSTPISCQPEPRLLLSNFLFTASDTWMTRKNKSLTNLSERSWRYSSKIVILFRQKKNNYHFALKFACFNIQIKSLRAVLFVLSSFYFEKTIWNFCLLFQGLKVPNW